MNAMLKTGGMLLILLSFTFLGYYKADLLKKRNKRLTELCMGLERLKGFVKNGSGDLPRLLGLSFSKELVLCLNGEIRLNSDYLIKEDIEILQGLLNELGFSNRESEEKRITLYRELLQKQQLSAEKQFAELSKLYTSLGFLTGLSICIFLI